MIKDGRRGETLVLFTGQNRIEMDSNACTNAVVNATGEAAELSQEFLFAPFIRLRPQGGDWPESTASSTYTDKYSQMQQELGTQNDSVFPLATCYRAETDAP